MAELTNWLSRKPFTLEVMGSSPISVTMLL